MEKRYKKKRGQREGEKREAFLGGKAVGGRGRVASGMKVREKLSARASMRSGYPGIIFQVLPLCEEFPRKAIFEIFKIHIIMAAKPVLIIK